MNKILSLLVVSSALAFSGVAAHAESLPQLEQDQISDRSTSSVGSYANGSDASVAQQEVEQFGNSARPDVDWKASRGNDDSLVHIEDEQIPH